MQLKSPALAGLCVTAAESAAWGSKLAAELNLSHIRLAAFETT